MGVGWQQGGDSGTGQAPGPRRPGRVPGLPGFAAGGPLDSCPPSAALAVALETAAGCGWRCPDASHDEMLGVLRQWQALEAWAAAGKLGVLRALIREDDQPLPGGRYRGDLPEGWTKSLTHEVALALSMPAVSADRLMWFAWDLQARFPGIGELLATGSLTSAKARAVCEPLQLLSDEDAARAEAMIVPELAGQTYGQAQKLAVQAALTVDPESATRRRQEAERSRSRVQMFREESGAAALSGRDMPTDETLAAHASVCARATVYQQSGLFPDDTRMDQFRVMAYLDLLNGVSADARLARVPWAATGESDGPVRTGGSPGDHERGDHERGDHEPGDHERGDHEPGDHDPDGRRTDDPGGDGPGPGGPGGPGPGGSGPGGSGPGGWGPAGRGPDGTGSGRLADSDPGESGPAARGSGASATDSADPGPSHRPADLIVPLATLLGLAERPGEGHRLGPLDPALCRDLAVAAAGSAATLLCVTVTGPGGLALGHGCIRTPATSSSRAALALPARVNLTIAAESLAGLAEPASRAPGQQAPGPPGQPGTGPPRWSFVRMADPGPPGGYGRWSVTLPTGMTQIVDLEPVPLLDCDHRHESHGYQPNDTLRHLVQVRDYVCTFPTCSRHARESDFEHALPYHLGGRTCTCNAGARSRQCHRVKQAKGWDVIQPAPGWHQWTTPSGRTYTQGPYRYPV